MAIAGLPGAHAVCYSFDYGGGEEPVSKPKSRASTQFRWWAPIYDGNPLQWFLFRPAHRVLMQEIESLGRSDLTMLDVGCGTGELLRRLKGTYPNSTVWGLDLSSHMLAKAAPKRIDHDPFFITRGDSEFLPFGAGSFDVVVCSNSFHHYPRQDEVVREMHRVLKPDGIACIVDGSIDGLLGRVIFRGIVETMEKDVHHCSRPELVELFQKAGFNGIRHASIFRGLPMLMTIGVANSP